MIVSPRLILSILLPSVILIKEFCILLFVTAPLPIETKPVFVIEMSPERLTFFHKLSGSTASESYINICAFPILFIVTFDYPPNAVAEDRNASASLVAAVPSPKVAWAVAASVSSSSPLAKAVIVDVANVFAPVV